ATVEPKVTATVEPQVTATLEPGVAVVGSAAASAAGGAAIVVAEPARPETGVTPGLSSSPPAGESYPQATTLPFERVDTGIGTYGAPGRDEIAAFRLTDVSGSASVRYYSMTSNAKTTSKPMKPLKKSFSY
ncbi:MAG: hypothetical protein MUP90_15315, partial [Gammaproteobacteria bacterium]|nr:hypothetical protein [Gammaproteobacteria bacterium]